LGSKPNPTGMFRTRYTRLPDLIKLSIIFFKLFIADSVDGLSGIRLPMSFMYPRSEKYPYQHAAITMVSMFDAPAYSIASRMYLLQPDPFKSPFTCLPSDPGTHPNRVKKATA